MFKVSHLHSAFFSLSWSPPASARATALALASEFGGSIHPEANMDAWQIRVTPVRNFQEVRKALLKCSDADRAYLRNWLIKYVDTQGRIIEEAKQEPLPEKGY